MEEEIAALAERLKKQCDEEIATSSSVRDLASLVDAAEDWGVEEQLVAAIRYSEVIERHVGAGDASWVQYLRSNAWAALLHIRRTPENVWAWEQPELSKQIYWLRAAIQNVGFQELSPERKAKIYCNLGNALSGAGRFVDALVEWRSALAVQPILGMARGNLGIGLARYGRGLYDDGHTYWLLRSSQDELRKALEGGVGRDGSTYPEALDAFREQLGLVEHELDQYEGTHDGSPEEYSLGDSSNEQDYRRWCLQRKLFLNPLNDLGNYSIAASDVLVLPSHRIEGAGITYRSFFNQLKQEYIYARWCLFNGSSAHEMHFADRNVLLESNADFAQYSIGLEQVKTSFRSAYSLLDKVAYFVNAYWSIGMPETQVSFRKIWYEDRKGQGVPIGKVRQVFQDSKNFPLLGLFRLSEDIFDKTLQEVSDPLAKKLDVLRNHLEHKCAKIVMDAVSTSKDDPSMFRDSLAHVVTREELYGRSEHMVRMSRSALIHLSLAMHVEEMRAPRSTKVVMPITFGAYPDDLKV